MNFRNRIERLTRLADEIRRLAVAARMRVAARFIGPPGRMPPLPVDATQEERKVYAMITAMDATIPPAPLNHEAN